MYRRHKASEKKWCWENTPCLKIPMWMCRWCYELLIKPQFTSPSKKSRIRVVRRSLSPSKMIYMWRISLNDFRLGDSGLQTFYFCSENCIMEISSGKTRNGDLLLSKIVWIANNAKCAQIRRPLLEKNNFFFLVKSRYIIVTISTNKCVR